MRVLTQRFRAIVLGLCSVGIGTLTNSRQLEAQEIEWTVTKLSKLFHGEGGTLADFDGDGSMDIAAGYQIFFGPDFKESTKLFASNPYNINGYSEYFFGFDADIDSDGDPDVLIVGFPGAASHWYRNPGKADARKANWERFTVMEVVDNESPMFKDIDGDGKPDLICSTAGQYGYASVGPDPTKPWVFHPVSEPGPYERFTHGIGVGDVNDDKYQDLLAKNGWWENPGAVSNANKLWVFHPFEFSGPGGAQMHAVDLDGDGKTEVVTSLAAHAYGLAVYKKSPGGKEYSWTRIDVMTDKPETSPTGLAISQLHAVEIADIDGDGKPDILTGKRFWAHNGNDPGENDMPLL
ncbi:MAG: VCBS repeat-containing protein, partial [Planctomycetota bacterium]